MSASPQPRSFDTLVEEAASIPIEGWDFSFVRLRTQTASLPWDYVQTARTLVGDADRVLDIDTGGGEIFGLLNPPAGSVALEPNSPNVDVAARHLEPHGIRVVKRLSELPAEDPGFDLVLNRHGHLEPYEVARVLRPGGRFLSQQVGPRNDIEFNEALDTAASTNPDAVAEPVQEMIGRLLNAGLTVLEVREATVAMRYLDVGAVVFQLRAVPWQVPGFSVDRHRRQLEKIHQQILKQGAFTVHSRRNLIQALR